MIQMRFDNYYNDYSELYKVNKLLLLLIAKYYDLDNMMQEQDLMSEQSYYISVSGDTISGFSSSIAKIFSEEAIDDCNVPNCSASSCIGSKKCLM